MAIFRPNLKLVHVAMAWLSRTIAIAFFGYATYAIYLGRVRIAARSTDVVIEFGGAPLPFVLAVCLYIGGGVLFIWIARLIGHKEAG